MDLPTNVFSYGAFHFSLFTRDFLVAHRNK